MCESKYTFSASFEGPCGALSLETQNPALRAVSCVFFCVSLRVAAMASDGVAAQRVATVTPSTRHHAIDAPSRRRRAPTLSTRHHASMRTRQRLPCAVAAHGVEFSADAATGQLKFLGLNLCINKPVSRLHGSVER